MSSLIWKTVLIDDIFSETSYYWEIVDFCPSTWFFKWNSTYVVRIHESNELKEIPVYSLSIVSNNI